LTGFDGDDDDGKMGMNVWAVCCWVTSMLL